MKFSKIGKTAGHGNLLTLSPSEGDDPTHDERHKFHNFKKKPRKKLLSVISLFKILMDYSKTKFKF